MQMRPSDRGLKKHRRCGQCLMPSATDGGIIEQEGGISKWLQEKKLSLLPQNIFNPFLLRVAKTGQRILEIFYL